MNAPHDGVNGDRSPGRELEPKVFDAEFIDQSVANALDRSAGPVGRTVPWWRTIARTVGAFARRVWQSGPVVRGRSVAAYRGRKAPVDATRLVWFVVRGHWRWLVKLWAWATYADLRADVHNARLVGDSEARRAAQELIRSDAKARWAKLGMALHRIAVTVRFLGPVAVLLWAVDSLLDRAQMWTGWPASMPCWTRSGRCWWSWCRCC
jgi:DNA segregation ATPase FtsK/SpoIIIE, S-DNA-T family